MMPSGRNKYQSREHRAVLRKVLMESWDPIGVYDVPEAQDEYDAYAAKAYVMLMDDQASERELAAYLYDIACNYMALGSSPELMEKSANAANLVAGLRPSFTTQ
jgi:hypothetical protein